MVVLCRFSGSQGRFKASVEALGRETDKKSDKTVRRALKALEKQGLITLTQTRRANGFNGLLIVEIKDSNYRAIGDSNYRASHDYVTNSPRSQKTDKSLVPNSQDSYKLKDIVAQEAPLKEIRISMKGYDDGDDLAGFGLVEDRDQPQKHYSKRDPKTRGKRPEHEWTPMDVAAEFSYRVGRKYPLLPGTVNVKVLAGALAKFRKQYGTTALIELELLRLFMTDESNFKHIGDEAPNLYKLYLASFGKRMNQARENLGLGRVAGSKEPTVKISTLTASDGRVFQNSMSGRAQLERYEKKIKGD
jgi:hypothetical protein